MSDNTITKYDRLYSDLHDVSRLYTRPSTVKNVQLLTGKAETFIVETVRHEERGDYIFIESMDETGLTRLALPPKVANAIASQRDSLTSRRRSIASRAIARARMDRGELPGFLRKKR